MNGRRLLSCVIIAQALLAGGAPVSCAGGADTQAANAREQAAAASSGRNGVILNFPRPALQARRWFGWPGCAVALADCLVGG